MTARTKTALIDLADKIQNLAAGVVHLTGTETASEVMGAAEMLKLALQQEPTTTIETDPKLCTSQH